MSSLDANKDLVRRFVAALNRGDHDALDGLVRPDFRRHCQATPEVEVRSLEAFKNFDRLNQTVFADQQAALQQIVAEGDLVAVWCVYTGTQSGQMGPFPATGKRMTVDFAGVFRVEDDKLAELWVTWDNLAGLTQLGHWPPEE
jgi:predicted ester cyclase